jgi:hypothetical protein
MLEGLFFYLPKIELASSLFLFGLIAYVQVVHYPLFIKIPAEAFYSYELSHQKRTSFVVIVPMCLELLSSSLIFFNKLFGAPANLFLYDYLGYSLLLLVWISTFFIQMPIHHALEKGCDVRLIKRLCITNWIRTFSWGIRSTILLFNF